MPGFPVPEFELPFANMPVTKVLFTKMPFARMARRCAGAALLSCLAVLSLTPVEARADTILVMHKGEIR